MSHLPTEAVAMMREAILGDPSLVLELAQMAGLPTSEDLEAQAHAVAQLETSQETRLSLLESTIQQLQTALASVTTKVNNLPDATTTQKGVTWFAGDGATTAGRAVQATDGRLSNARTPLAHSHAISDVTNLQGTLDGKASTALATSTVNGLMSSTDKAKADATPRAQSLGRASLPAIGLVTPVDVVITFDKPMPDTNYECSYSCLGASIGSFNVISETKSKDKVITRLGALVVINANTATIRATATALSY